MNLQEVRDHIKAYPISSIIGRYLSLTKRGQQTLALCPFHADSRPSLTVNDHKGLYMCFVCQKGGDAINFVERYKGLDFKDAVLEIGQALGLSVEDLQFRPEKKDPRLQMGLRILSAAARLYQKLGQEKDSSVFHSFVKKRNLSAEVVQEFQLGLAPAQNALVQYLKALPEADSEEAMKLAMEIGIIRFGKGTHYDTFRERIIFPIWNSYGQVVGLGGRATQDYQQGKYINSQDSLLFNKKQLLYGFHFARQAIRDQGRVILVEGYMDLIALHKNGIKECVAVMGVALGDSSLRGLMALTHTVYLALDSDAAGLMAMARINQSFMKEGILPKYLSFSPAKDPDEFMEGAGPLKFATLLEEAPTFVDYWLEKEVPEIIPDNPDQKLKILRKIFTTLTPLKSDLRATERIVAWAKRLKLKSGNEEILSSYKAFLDSPEALSMLKSKESLAPVPLKTPLVAQEKRPKAGPHQEIAVTEITIPRLEGLFLQEIVKRPEVLGLELLPEVLDFVSQNEVKRMVSWLKNFVNEINLNEYPEMLLMSMQREGFSLELRELVGAALFHFKKAAIDDKKSGPKILFDFKKKLMEATLKKERALLQEKQASSSSEEEILETLKEIGSIQKKLDQLKVLKMKTDKNKTA